MDSRQCRGTTKAGDRCTARAAAGSLYCVFHDPAREDERREWSAKGGRNKNMERRLTRLVKDAEELTAPELLRLLSGAMLMLLEGDLDPARLNALATAAKTVDAIRTSSELERRLDELEAVLSTTARPNVS